MTLGAVRCIPLLDRVDGLFGMFMFESVVNNDAEASSSPSDSSEVKLFVSASESKDSNNGDE